MNNEAYSFLSKAKKRSLTNLCSRLYIKKNSNNKNSHVNHFLSLIQSLTDKCP